MDTSVATVNNGVVKAVGEGETQIRVVSELYGWAEAVCELTVLPNGPDDVNRIDVLAPGDGKFGVDHQSLRMRRTNRSHGIPLTVPLRQ